MTDEPMTTSERDELADLIECVWVGTDYQSAGIGPDDAKYIADLLIKAGYRKESEPEWIDPQCDEVADIDYEVNAQIRCKLESGHKGDCEPEG